jgi:hypothetical protein
MQRLISDRKEVLSMQKRPEDGQRWEWDAVDADTHELWVDACRG